MILKLHNLTVGSHVDIYDDDFDSDYDNVDLTTYGK